ncbi:hypothetical protein NUSPORA_01064 [Nucleospora cyclopteri]
MLHLPIMSSGSECAICFGEYTTVGDHSIISLKCGHIFGKQCIERWLFDNKNRVCPTCSAPVRKVHLRPLYVEGIKSVDSQQQTDLINKYRNEHELVVKLQKEILELKIEIEVLKLKKTESKKETGEFSIPRSLKKIHKIYFDPTFSIVAFDPLNEIILISCKKGSDFGIFFYSAVDFTINKFIKLDQKVTSIKISPYNDSLCLIATGTKITLMNVLNKNVIFEERIENAVTSVLFDQFNRNRIFYGTSKGNFFVLDLLSLQSTEIADLKHAINGIEQIGDTFYLCSIFNAYRVVADEMNDVHTVEKLWENAEGIFTAISSHKNAVFYTLREKTCRIHAYLIWEGREQMNYINVQQKQKYFNKIIENYLVLVENERRSILFFNIEKAQNETRVTVREEIIDFYITGDFLIILTKQNIYVYK